MALDIATEGLNRCPILSSERLLFKPLCGEDVSSIILFLSDYETVFCLTYANWPYTVQDAVLWLTHVNRLCASGNGCFWGVHNHGNEFLGTAGLSLFPEHEKAELHYWLGKPYWGKGYGTEMARSLVEYSFRTIGVKRLEVNHMTRNVRSQRVIEKCGFRLEGTMRAYVKRFDLFEDVKFYSLLREEFEQDWAHQNYLIPLKKE
ncbi:MAG: GNAT family N-acetyltransferase [Puniceicoccales bacterium]|nr:GNAT family N-acetyltransferase [Puniceicoccales bacterium]